VAGFFTAVGAGVSGIVCAALLWIGVLVVGNVYGGWIGAKRLWRLHHGKAKRPRIKWVARHAIHCWPGRRYDGNVGEYWDLGAMKVPLDGRDKIRRRNW